MSARRPCMACEGTGEQGPCWHGICWDNECPACAGRGWQSDAMPVSDALADAETLANAVAVLADGRSRIRGISKLWRYAARVEDDVFETPEDAARLATIAARAAFRAVPELRG